MKVETGNGETWLGDVGSRTQQAEAAGFDAIGSEADRVDLG